MCIRDRILAIWEGTPHRQMLDGLEVMQRKDAHRLLFQHLAGKAPEPQLREMEARVDRQLGLPEVEREGTLEKLFCDLASFTADTLSRAGSMTNEFGSLAESPTIR